MGYKVMGYKLWVQVMGTSYGYKVKGIQGYRVTCLFFFVIIVCMIHRWVTHYVFSC